MFIKQRMLAALLILLGVCNMGDYLFTIKGLQQGAEEVNPISRILLEQPPSYLLLKIVFIPGALYFLWQKRNLILARSYLLQLLLLVLTVYLGVMIHFLSNLHLLFCYQ